MQKYEKIKVSLCLYGGSKPPPYDISPIIANRQNKDKGIVPEKTTRSG